MQPEIKYKYGYQDNKIVYVGDLRRDNISKKDTFSCISCGDNLIPRLGEKRQKHFAHKKGAACSSETYLHKLGKEIFQQEFSYCLETKQPFILEFYKNQICTLHKDEFGIECNVGKYPIDIDLTKHFDTIDLEQNIGEYRPDILLSNSKNDNILFFEIAVTHQLSEEKKNSDYKIIEISVKTDNELDTIRKHRISYKDTYVNLVNFKPKDININVNVDDCPKRYDSFMILRNGKCRYSEEKRLTELAEEKNATIYKKHIIEFNFTEHIKEYWGFKHLKYRYLLGKSLLDNKYIKSCLVCKYHAINRKDKYDSIPFVFCKFLKSYFHSMHAADCEYFKSDITIAKEYIDNWENKIQSYNERIEYESLSKEEQRQKRLEAYKQVEGFFSGIFKDFE